MIVRITMSAEKQKELTETLADWEFDEGLIRRINDQELKRISFLLRCRRFWIFFPESVMIVLRSGISLSSL